MWQKGNKQQFNLLSDELWIVHINLKKLLIFVMVSIYRPGMKVRMRFTHQSTVFQLSYPFPDDKFFTLPNRKCLVTTI